MSMPINFTLSALDTSFNLDFSGILNAQAPATLTSHATAVYYVKTSDMKKVFKFETDAFDVNDFSNQDLKYYIFRNAFWPANLNINPANSMMNKAESYSEFATLQTYDTSKNLLKHDFLRYLAYRLFNTSLGVDLFSNETALIENISLKGQAVHTNIMTALNLVDASAGTATPAGGSDLSGNKFYTNDLSGNTNLCREIMKQIAFSNPSRFVATVDGSGTMIDASSGLMIQSVPFMNGDSLNFLLTINAAANQHTLTGVAAIPARIYNIKLVLKSDATAINTNPQDGGANSLYAYY